MEPEVSDQSPTDDQVAVGEVTPDASAAGDLSISVDDTSVAGDRFG